MRGNDIIGFAVLGLVAYLGYEVFYKGQTVQGAFSSLLPAGVAGLGCAECPGVGMCAATGRCTRGMGNIVNTREGIWGGYPLVGAGAGVTRRSERSFNAGRL